MSDSADRLSRLEETLQRLTDVEEIKKLKARYYRYLDLHWWDRLREVFTGDAAFEIAESSAPLADRDAFIERVTTHLGTAMTVHHGHMPEIEIVDERHATGIWSMFDSVEPPEDSGYPLLTGFGHYTEEYRKESGTWRISRMRLTRLKRDVAGETVEGQVVAAPRPFREP